MSRPIEARYFDGRTASAQPAQILLEPDGGIRFNIDGGLEERRAKSDIRVAARLSGLPRRLEMADGAFFELRDDEAVDRWCRNSRDAALTGWLTFAENRWSFVLVLAVAAIAAGWAVYRFGVPLAAKPIAELVPAAAVEEIDKAAMHTLDATLLEPAKSSAAARREVRSALYDLVRDHEYNLQFRSMGGIANAFALPGGTIVVTDQLMADLTIDEVRAVLAHEIAHVEERHGLQMVVRAAAFPVMIGFALGDVSAMLGSASALPSLLISQSYSREMELEADLVGARLLASRGYHPLALAGALTELVGEEKSNTALSWLDSHPDTTSRIQAIEHEVDRLGF